MTSEPTRERSPAVPVLHPTGDVDAYSAPEFRAQLHDATSSGAGLVVVDLTDITFIDSAGLGALVGAHRRMLDGGGRLRIVRPPPLVGRAFELTGLHEVLDLCANRDEALIRA